MNETRTHSLSPFAALLVVLDSLIVGVGIWCGLKLLDERLSMLVYRRLLSVRGRMARLLARFQAGRLVVAPTVGAGVRAVVVEGEKKPVVARVWPAGFAWLVRIVAWRATGLGGQLQHVLEQPEMVELLRSVPQVRRISSPVCRMLAIPAAVLRPRQNEVAVEVVVADLAPKVKRVRKRPPPVDWGRIPLPRGILTAARRTGFKPVR